MPNFKDITESRAVPITEQELREFLESKVWLAFCQYVRTQQRGIHSGIRTQQPEMRGLMYQHVDILDDVLNTPSKIRDNNLYVEKPEVKNEILAHLREQLKGDVEQWKPKQ